MVLYNVSNQSIIIHKTREYKYHSTVRRWAVVLYETSTNKYYTFQNVPEISPYKDSYIEFNVDVQSIGLSAGTYIVMVFEYKQLSTSYLFSRFVLNIINYTDYSNSYDYDLDSSKNTYKIYKP